MASGVSGLVNEDLIMDKSGSGPSIRCEVRFEVIHNFPFDFLNSARENTRLLFFPRAR